MTRPDAPSTLPDRRHAARLPADLAPEALARIRQNAYALPQVVQPADFDLDGASGPEADAALDRRGLVLLQKAAAGARPSRWIEPGLVHEALAYLDALGSRAASRAVLAERTATLESLGIVRQGSGWLRRGTVTVTPSPPAPPLSVSRQDAIDAAPVWAFFRTGDREALLRSLGEPPPWLPADDLRAQVDSLVARSLSGHPQHIDTLWHRLQAECAAVRPWPVLQQALTRAQARWEQAADELDALHRLTRELAFQGYPDSFAAARRVQRSVRLYVGPPNSGKTHAAFERLREAHDGAYLAPLRLLALEGRDRLVARGVPCSLLTGEEKVLVPGAHIVSSTIEMVDTSRPVDVAVIDEAQMIFDASRGWAWTQAIVGVAANELIVICSAFAVPALQKLLALCGEACVVRHFERKQHVQRLPRPVPLAQLTAGDAVVAFSRRDVLMLRDRIAAAGHTVSVIYGALPPEVRRREAERYAQGESDLLVATDAIGMGLNLPIRRVIFSTLTKFDGRGDRALDVSEVHQIAGRAGRFGLHEEGFAGVLDEAEPDALRALATQLAKTPEAPDPFKAPVAPNWWHIETIASRLGVDRLRQVLDVFIDQLRLDDAHFEVAQLEQMQQLAEQLDSAARGLTLKQRFVYAQAPVDTRTDSQVQEYLGWATSHALTGRAGTPWFLDAVDSHSRLERMEQALRSCTLWLWLDLRFTGVYGHIDEVLALRARLNEGIERQLKGKKPLAQLRQRGRR